LTQTEMILNHLKTKGRITPLEALNLYGCFRLGARVYDLRQRGVQITRVMVDAQKPNGKKERFAAYYLTEAQS